MRFTLTLAVLRMTLFATTALVALALLERPLRISTQAIVAAERVALAIGALLLFPLRYYFSRRG